MPEMVFLNGEIIAADEARISAFDAGLTHAAGLFETLRAYHGRIMRIAEHTGRLMSSAAALELHLPVHREDLDHALVRVLEANELMEARLRLVVTPGMVPRGGEGADVRPTVLASASAVQKHPREQYENGWRVCISPYRTNKLDPLAGHKTLSYLPRLMALRDAAKRNCNESLWFTTENMLAEGSICNVFIVSQGKLLTPAANAPLLPGTVRKAVIELASASGMEVEESEIDINGLLAAEEVFLTGSVLEVMPVTSIEKHMVGTGRPGEVTKRMMGLYTELVRKECGG